MSEPEFWPGQPVRIKTTGKTELVVRVQAIKVMGELVGNLYITESGAYRGSDLEGLHADES